MKPIIACLLVVTLSAFLVIPALGQQVLTARQIIEKADKNIPVVNLKAYPAWKALTINLKVEYPLP